YAFGIAAWPWLPDRIDSHWGPSGAGDDTMSRTRSVILLPSITLGLWALLLVLPRIDPKQEDYDRFNATYRLIVNGTAALVAPRLVSHPAAVDHAGALGAAARPAAH